MVHGDAREGKWRWNCRMEWVASTLHTTSEHGVSSITTTDAHTSAASSRLNWRPRRFKWTRPFRRKMKSGFCACAITFQLASTITQFHNFFFSKWLFTSLSIIRIYSNLESELLTLPFYKKFFTKVLLNSSLTQSWCSICDTRVNKYGIELHWQKKPNSWDMEQVLVPFRPPLIPQ